MAATNSRRSSLPRLRLLAAAVALLLAAPEPAVPDVYTWVDESGTSHYTTDPDRIPRNLRDPDPPGTGEPSGDEAPIRLREVPGPLRRGALRAEPLLWSIPGPREAATPGRSTVESQMARDRETLKELIDGTEEDPTGWLRDPRLREIAERLRRLEAEREAEPGEE